MSNVTFEDIVQLWATNSPIVMINAYRTSIRQSSEIPEAVKGLLCGINEYDAGLIARHWGLIQQMIGNVELAYRRGEQRKDVAL